MVVPKSKISRVLSEVQSRKLWREEPKIEGPQGNAGSIIVPSFSLPDTLRADGGGVGVGVGRTGVRTGIDGVVTNSGLAVGANTSGVGVGGTDADGVVGVGLSKLGLGDGAGSEEAGVALGVGPAGGRVKEGVGWKETSGALPCSSVVLVGTGVVGELGSCSDSPRQP